ncbi:MAG: hypothetical protein A3H01_01550 [Candidatus Wildermuthbacteria bacterium RIFCSPLOWO2_12_FULL_40_9]|uniref:Solute-binding protein family 5 domain-containing protein n=2 Tax=Candidatus Wildermuthiibacteriota TaxID=1817923 RepID=A0A1G2RE02_9BACT|nr:MAG: hypothetical protein A3F15_03025 [Candidatus Wildermuthbacteria bacterium RIFCSPHIGHO2_12_FULL_40_12]OHA76781.1 MAG: hypothetical protein A3H01_01550 [Candidatus Wildermuthbacteria bacterium RIFCSPLOWO2_12_FULL_40_9]
MGIIPSIPKLTMPTEWPSVGQWRQIFKVLTKKEKPLFIALLILLFVSAFSLAVNFYLRNTTTVAANGGSFIEGVVGHPRFINPIYSEVSDVDRDLVQIIFAGLMKYNEEGALTPDLAKEYKILENGKTFEITLRENLLWQDGKKLTADDVVFTIETIQNSDYKSPLRASWVGIETEKISESVLRFKLRNPSVVFLENLTVKIIPLHIWEKIQPEQFPLSIYNLNPVGSGPYKLEDIKQDRSGYIKAMALAENEHYFGEKPKIKKLTFNFYATETDLVRAGRKKEIQGFSLLKIDDLKFFGETKFTSRSFPLSRYFAVFFNIEKSDILSNKNARQALNYGTDKAEIIERTLKGYGKIVISPVLPESYGLKSPDIIYEFDREKAKEALDKAGFVEVVKDCAETDENDTECGKIIREKTIKRETISQFKNDLKLGSQGIEVKELQRCLSMPPAGGPDIYPEAKITGSFDQKTQEAVNRFQEKYAKDILEPSGFDEGTGMVSKATREKLNELCDLSAQKTIPLKIALTTVNQSPLIEVANALKEQWATIGVELIIEALSVQDIEKNIIKDRNYETLLFGEVLSETPDPLPFWHSLQKKDPGSNLSLYENKKTDGLLEDIRQSLDLEVRTAKLEEFQNLLLEDAPAVFLYSQDYIYLTSKNIKGITETLIADPSERFSGITDWYIKTSRRFAPREP